MKLNSSTKSNIDFIAAAIFFIYFIIGCSILTEVKMTIDETIDRNMGVTNIRYIMNVFGLDKNENPTYKVTSLDNYMYRSYGTLYSMVSFSMEKIFRASNLKQSFQIRHYVIFILYIASLISFYFSARKITLNKISPLLATLLIITYPKLFGEGLFNVKDLVLLSLFNIALSFLIRAIIGNKKNINLIMVGAFTGFAISCRPVAIILLAGVMGLFFILLMTKQIKIKEFLLYNLIFAGTVLLATYISWPYLWTNPIDHFIYSYNVMKQYEWCGPNYFMGEVISACGLKWYYAPIWLLISIPELHLILIFVSVLLLIRNIKENFLDKSKLMFLFGAGIFLLPLMAVVYYQSHIYNSWRHLYFIFAGAMYLILYGIDYMLEKFQHLKKIILGIVVVQVSINIWFISSHFPYQYAYFNSASSLFAPKNFNIDYWDMTIWDGLNKVVDNLKSPTKIYIRGGHYGYYSVLDSSKRKNVIVMDDPYDADFAITPPDTSLIKYGFRPISSIAIFDVKVMNIYKKE